jgi:WD40 repeat protein
MKLYLIKLTILFTFNSICFNLIAQSTITLVGHSAPINGVLFSEDGKYLYSASKDQKIIQWDIDNNFNQKNTITLKEGSVSSICLINNTELLAGTFGNIYKIYFSKGASKKTFKKKAHSTFITSLSYSKKHNLVFSSSWRDETLVAWNYTTGKAHKKYNETAWTDFNISLNDYLISSNHENQIKIWDIKSGNILKTIAAHEDWTYKIALDTLNNRFFTVGLDGKIAIWDSKTFKPINAKSNCHKEGIISIAFNAKQNILITGGMDNKIKIWDSNTLELINELNEHTGIIIDLKFSNDYTKFASASADKTIKIWTLNNLINKENE